MRIYPEHISREHPIFTREYCVFTPPISEMLGQLVDWIEDRETGGYIHGPSRFGKSYAVRWWLEQELRAEFGATIPLVSWSRVPGTQINEAQFWNALLRKSGYAFATDERQYAGAKARMLLVNQLVTAARYSRGNYIVLLIDEAQAMSLNEWLWLMGLQNELEDKSYYLSVFSVGTQQMKYEFDGLVITGNAHVAARFHLNHARFHGIDSVDNLRFVFRGYDQESEWPSGSGISYTQYFARVDYETGKKLEDIAATFWECLCTLSPVKPKQNGYEFPMRTIAQSVEKLLKHAGQGVEEWDELVRKETLLKIIHSTAFSKHMEIISGDVSRQP